jgi:ABC-2 type transport system permease protein
MADQGWRYSVIKISGRHSVLSDPAGRNGPLMGLLALYTELPTSTLLSCYLGLFLLGSAFISLGLLISTLTENQIVAGAVTFGGLLMFWALSFGVDRKSGTVADILKELSILKHLEPFFSGMINSTDICYYIAFIALALFLTARVIEADRGNG